jgi:hypothetical protein
MMGVVQYEDLLNTKEKGDVVGLFGLVLYFHLQILYTPKRSCSASSFGNTYSGSRSAHVTGEEIM